MERPGNVGIVERPRPTPGPTDVLVQVLYANVCHTDHFIIRGGHPSARYPVVPGHEFSGVIAEVGAEVPSTRVGERVTVQTQLGCGMCAACRDGRVGSCPMLAELGSTRDGGWQEFLVVPRDAAIPLPNPVSLLEGSLTEPSANAYAAVAVAGIQSTDTVAVIGPGPIGLLALQHAALRSPRELILVGREVDTARVARGQELGASMTVAKPSADIISAVLQATSGHGCDAVIQCAGSVSATATAMQIVGDRGRIVVEGFAASSETIQLSPDQIAIRELRLQGVRGWTQPQFMATLDLHATCAIALKPLVTHLFALADYRDALARSLDYASGAVKVCFAMGSTEAG